MFILSLTCRPIDKRRARQIQIKKRDALLELESRSAHGKSGSSLLATVPLAGRKKRKKGRVPETNRGGATVDIIKRSKKEDKPQNANNSSFGKNKKRRSSKPEPRSRLNRYVRWLWLFVY